MSVARSFYRLASIATLALCAVFIGAGGPAPASGEEPRLGRTLERIKRNGEIRIGVRDSDPPFSYRLPDGRHVGYGMDHSNIIADVIRKKLGMPDLKARAVPITSANRIVLLQNGLYDFECGSTTHSRERSWRVGFSNTYFIVGTRLLVNRDSGIRDFPDLRGRTVAVTTGTTSETLIEQMNRDQGAGVTILSLPSNAEAFSALQDGKADAWFIDDAMLAGERTTARDPSRWQIVGKPRTLEAIACMMARNDPAFKRLVDDTIADIQRSGLAEQIYYRWFLAPIPPRNISLDFTLSKEMIDLFRSPNDRYYD